MAEDGVLTTGEARRTATRRAVLGAVGGGLAATAGCATALQPLRERTLIATWRGHDPTAAVTLQWLARDRQTAATTVELTAPGAAPVGTETDVARFGPSRYYRARGDVSGLRPGTEYAVGVDGTDTGFTVRTAPARLEAPLVFAEGGDIGTSNAVPKLHRQAAAWDPLFAVVGGDLAYADGTEPRRWVTFLEHWHEHMRAGDRLIPIVAAIGNHEVRGGLHGTPADAPFFYALFDNAARERAYWTLDLGSYCSVVLLDTNHTTPLAGDQAAWLRETLAGRAGRPHRMAAYHVPAYPSSKAISGAGRDRASVRAILPPEFDRHDLDVAFEHDDHAYKRTKPLRGGEPDDDGVVYLGDGAWGKGPRPVHTPEERPYLAKAVSSLNVIRTELRPDGSQRFRAVDETGAVIDRYARD